MIKTSYFCTNYVRYVRMYMRILRSKNSRRHKHLTRYFAEYQFFKLT